MSKAKFAKQAMKYGLVGLTGHEIGQLVNPDEKTEIKILEKIIEKTEKPEPDNNIILYTTLIIIITLLIVLIFLTFRIIKKKAQKK